VRNLQYKIKDLPESERPRERLRNKGPKSLSDAELLALIIRSGTENNNAVEASKQILAEYDLEELNNTSVNELKDFHGIGEVKAGQIVGLFEFCRRFSEGSHEKSGKIKSYEDALDYFEPALTHKEDENLAMICLDSKNHVLNKDIENSIIAKGSIDKVNVGFRRVVKKALKENAAGVILAHNHPGGKAKPTEGDIDLTKEISKILESVDVQLLDHIILGEGGFQSFREEEIIPFE